MGALLGVGKEGYMDRALNPLSFSVVSGYHTGGVMCKDNFLSLPFALDREVVGSNPVTGKKLSDENSILEIKVDVLSRHTEVANKLSYLTSFTCNLLESPRTFLPFFLLPLQSLSKLLTLTRIPTDFPISSILSFSLSPVWIISSLSALCG